MSYRRTSAQLWDILDKQGLATGARPVERIKRPINYTESRNQQACVRWWSVVCKGYGLPEYALIAHPNQGWRSPKNGARMKAEGARKGTLDMQLTVARGGYHGLWIENKTEDGKLTYDQINHRDHLMSQGYSFRLCRSLNDFVTAVTFYLAQ